MISNSSSPLESLQVSDISTGDEIAKLHACADTLKQCGLQTVIDLSDNGFGDEGAKVLGDGLRQCSKLSKFYLDGNKISSEGAMDLSDKLRQCSNLYLSC